MFDALNALALAHRRFHNAYLQHEAHDGRGDGACDKACHGTRDNGLFGCGAFEKRCDLAARCFIGRSFGWIASFFERFVITFAFAIRFGRFGFEMRLRLGMFVVFRENVAFVIALRIFRRNVDWFV